MKKNILNLFQLTKTKISHKIYVPKGLVGWHH